MASARTSVGLRTGALTSVFVVVGAIPAGAVIDERAGLSPGCIRHSDRSVICTYAKPTADAIVVDVPTGVTAARITVRGGNGGKGQVALDPVFATSTTPGGPGGSASATIRLDHTKNLEVRVGGAGAWGAQGGAGGTNGGGRGSVGTFANGMTVMGGGGGGGSEVRVAGTNPATDNPLIAAGGGGGGGSGLPGPPLLPFFVGPGGTGGGINGGPGAGAGDAQSLFGGGGGGSQTAAGRGGSFLGSVPTPVVGTDGTRGAGGDAAPEQPGIGSGGAGGGGGGYFGGGGGSAFSGGGGGSGFGPTGTRFGSGPNTPTAFTASSLADGEVVIEFLPPRKP